MPGMPECMIESNYNKASIEQLKEYRSDLRALTLSSGFMGMSDPIIYSNLNQVEKAIFAKESFGKK